MLFFFQIFSYNQSCLAIIYLFKIIKEGTVDVDAHANVDVSDNAVETSDC